MNAVVGEDMSMRLKRYLGFQLHPHPQDFRHLYSKQITIEGFEIIYLKYINQSTLDFRQFIVQFLLFMGLRSMEL